METEGGSRLSPVKSGTWVPPAEPQASLLPPPYQVLGRTPLLVAGPSCQGWQRGFQAVSGKQEALFISVSGTEWRPMLEGP